jgi:hypothetical protein
MNGIAHDRTYFIEDFRCPGGGYIAPGRKRENFTQAAALHLPLGGDKTRIEAAYMANHQIAPGRSRRIADALAIRDRTGHGLFEENMLAGSQRRQCGIGMLVPHGGDAHRIDVGVLQQLIIIGVGFLDAEFWPSSAKRSDLRVQSAASSSPGMPEIA